MQTVLPIYDAAKVNIWDDIDKQDGNKKKVVTRREVPNMLYTTLFTEQILIGYLIDRQLKFMVKRFATLAQF